MRYRMLAAAGLALGMTAPALAQLEETFPDPMRDWTGRWLYQNGTIGNYYVAAGNCDENNRGNNPQGLWIVDTQACGSGVGGSVCEVKFKPEFGATVSSFGFGMEAFVRMDVRIYDIDGNEVAALIGVSGGGFDFDHRDRIDAAGINGISRFVMDSRPYGGSQVEGNTSVDNFKAETGPPPPPPCYADCDKNGRLDIRDFFCFQAQYAAGCP